MKRYLSLVIAVLFIAFGFSNAYAGNVPEVVLSSAKGVFSVETQFPDDISSGSAFVISNDHKGTFLLTNYHVVQDNLEGVSIWIGEKEKTHATVEKFNEQYDLALLKSSQPLESPVLKITTNAKLGDEVYAVGFPTAAEYLSESTPRTAEDVTITNGVIGSIRSMKLVEFGPEIKVLQINADINPGNSGGPLLNMNGEVVGVNTYRVVNASGINGAIDASIIKEFVGNYGLMTNEIKPGYWIYAIGLVVIALIASVIFFIRRNKKGNRRGNMNQNILSIDDFIKILDRPLSEHDIVSLMMPLAIELRDKHDQGLLYLKLSPQKLIITREGIRINPTLVMDEFVQQKFLAPEQLCNRPVSPQTDIYSFCAVLQTLFSFTSKESSENILDPVENQIAKREFGHDETQVNTIVENVLPRIIQKGMQEEPDSRFHSFQDLIFEMAGLNLGVSESINELLESKQLQKEKFKRKKSIFGIIAGLISLLLIGFSLYQLITLNQANNYLKNQDYKQAQITIYRAIAPEVIFPRKFQYIDACTLMEAKLFDKAYKEFADLGDFFDAPTMALETKYRQAASLADNGEFDAAIKIYEEINGYKDSADLIESTLFRQGNYLVEKGSFQKALTIFVHMTHENYPNAAEMILATNYAWGLKYSKDEDYLNAYLKFQLAKDYKDTREFMARLKPLIYLQGQDYYRSNQYNTAEKYFSLLGDYLDTKIYLLLIEINNNTLFASRSIVFDKLVPNLYLEDVSELLVKNRLIAQVFLEGRWSCYEGYFTMKSDGSTTYNLPWYDGDYYDIKDGILYVYYKNQPNKHINVYRFEVLSKNMINVYAYKNSRTYLLFRN